MCCSSSSSSATANEVASTSSFQFPAGVVVTHRMLSVLPANTDRVVWSRSIIDDWKLYIMRQDAFISVLYAQKHDPYTRWARLTVLFCGLASTVWLFGIFAGADEVGAMIVGGLWIFLVTKMTYLSVNLELLSLCCRERSGVQSCFRWIGRFFSFCLFVCSSIFLGFGIGLQVKLGPASAWKWAVSQGSGLVQSVVIESLLFAYNYRKQLKEKAKVGSADADATVPSYNQNGNNEANRNNQVQMTPLQPMGYASVVPLASTVPLGAAGTPNYFQPPPPPLSYSSVQPAMGFSPAPTPQSMFVPSSSPSSPAPLFVPSPRSSSFCIVPLQCGRCNSNHSVRVKPMPARGSIFNLNCPQCGITHQFRQP